MKFFKIRCGFYPAAAPWAVGRAERVPHMGMSTTICLRGRGSPVGRALRVPPTGTRKSASADGVVPTFFLCLRSCEHGAGVWGSGGTRRARSPYGHEQNAALRQEDSPVGRAERVPPTGTRKSSRAAHLLPFICAHISTPAASDACANEKQPLTGLLLLVGAGGRTRTDTDFTPQDFESSASASFTTPAQITIYHSTGKLTSVLRSSARERSLCTFHGD